MKLPVSTLPFITVFMATMICCRPSTEPGIYFGETVISGGEDRVKLLLPGNWADPSVVKVDEMYYLTVNNDLYVPSVIILQSTDLRHWFPVTYASPLEGQGPATDIAEVGKRLFIYGGGGAFPWVMFADPPYEVWSERLNLEPLANHSIDPGHIMDGEGNRYLYMAGGKMVKLSVDGFRATTEPVRVYDGWDIPDEIAIECICLESPKLFRRDGWYYLVSAMGGTAGPSTSHMAVVARAQYPEGPWEDSPYNPLIWTRDESEVWWSKGHATLIEGPNGDWFAIYHGYRHGQRSWGRSTLVSPVEWNNEGWPVLSTAWPDGWDDAPTVNLPVGDEFDGERMGWQWQAYGSLDTNRYSLVDEGLEILTVKEDPGSSNPLTANPRDLAYEVETEMLLDGDVYAGLILFYAPDAYITLGLTADSTVLKHKHTFHSGTGEGGERTGTGIPYSGTRIRLKIRNDRQDASFYYAAVQDESWTKLERSDDVSGFQHNVYGSFSSIRPGFFVTGDGKARFEYFRYKALPRQK
jgi:xylan 1,4-beta-xylosidase